MQQLQPSKNPGSSSIFNISEQGINELNKAGIDLNGLFLLDCLKNNIELPKLNAKMEAWQQGLTRKGYITESGRLTVLGTSLLYAVENGVSFSKTNGVMATLGRDKEFEQWWKIYPSTDVFEYKGKKFQGTRGFRVKKTECFDKFKKILNENEVTSEDLIRALEYEILLKKEGSFREGENKLKYMQNSLTYLTQRTFENFVEISKVSKVNIKSPNNMDL